MDATLGIRNIRKSHLSTKKPLQFRFWELATLADKEADTTQRLESRLPHRVDYWKAMQWEYVDKNRDGDHICYITTFRRCRRTVGLGRHQVLGGYLLRAPPGNHLAAG